MNIYVPRTCTEVAQHHPDDPAAHPKPKPLREFADRPAIVLLGAPGAGKTTAFKQEEKEQAGCYVTARDFDTFENRPEWRKQTLFIDGLDEIRAGTSDQRTPFDRIRAKLDNLGQPPFRLSCREADWFGATDRAHLESVSRNGKVLVLRLDPLSGEGIRKILGNRGIKDVEDFISTARKRGIETLLENPQTLEMLVTAVAGGHWPETRAQTFELACRRLLSEHNREHHLAAQQQHSDEVLLDAAGHLCALLLLSGRTGCHWMADQGDAEFISLSGISTPSQDILNRTIHTKLFNVENGLAAPIHRHIAEFLAGRHLAGLIANGLPVGRILALSTGEDGSLVSELRGLSAWLAAHSTLGRSIVIERDPQGVVLYGDVKRFSVNEKRLVLTYLEREAESVPWAIAKDRELNHRWGDLATADMSNLFADLLTNEPTNDARQAVVYAILTSLRQGHSLANLQPILMNLIRDQARWFGIRELALGAYIKRVGEDNQAKQELQNLLEDVHSGAVSDPDDQLLGSLLQNLYPLDLSPSDIGRYFRMPKNENFPGTYTYFWTSAFVRETKEPDQAAQVLDSLVEHLCNGIPENINHRLPSPMKKLPQLLLGTYFRQFDASNGLDKQRLFSWLHLSANVVIYGNFGDGAQAVKDWFSHHPEQYKAIFRMAVDRSVPFWQIDRFLFHATPPRDFASWCIDQALKEGDNNLVLEYLDKAMGFLDASLRSNDLSPEVLEMRLAERPDLLNHYRKRLIQQQQGSSQQTEWEKQALERQQRGEEERRKKSEKSRDVVERHASELRANCAPPRLLHQLAKAYFGFFLGLDGNTGRDRLISLLGGDEHLANLVLGSFRESTKRCDLPQASEILRLSIQNRQHLLALPFAAGLKELADELSVGRPPLNEDGLRRALALHFNGIFPFNENCLKNDIILACQPGMVAESLVHAFRVSIRKGAEHYSGLYELAHDPSYSEVARIAVPQLMQAFPNRCKVQQLKMLKQILIAALKHCERDVFLEVAERRLAVNSLNTAQRVYWLAARLLRCPQSTTAPLTKVLTGRGSERQATHLAAFLTEELDPWIAGLSLPAKELLVQTIGKLYRPYGLGERDNETRIISDAEAAGRPLVDSLIGQMATKPTVQAAKTLERLAEHRALCHWHPRLRHAAQQQRGIRREACFIHKTPKQIQDVLLNGRPANSADLAALATDHLRQLAEQIRHGETSDWRQYWNTDSAKRPQEPKHEELCRDALLSDLRSYLAPHGVSAQPEGQYANDKRADIRICCERLNVPIEIKKNSHRDLWTAIRSQLIAQYARDPGANGHGIYLVFWFGPKRTKAMPPTGARPNTAKALEECLCAQLSAAEARKISVVVVDVAQPANEP